MNRQRYGFARRWSVLHIMLMVCIVAMAAQAKIALAHEVAPYGAAALEMIAFDQNLDQHVPTDLAFLDEEGQRVALSGYLQGKPVILAMTYFECENLCPLIVEGLVNSLQPLTFTAGEEFDVVFVSIDPEETPTIATAVKNETLKSYARPGSEGGWHFLTGDHETIDQLADAIGFRYVYDPERDEYAHASGIVMLTPVGKIARYFYGIEYAPKDVRLGLVEASQNRIGTPVDQLLLFCYHYEPGVGKYNLLVMNIVRLAGGMTVAVMGVALFALWRQGPQGRNSEGRNSEDRNSKGETPGSQDSHGQNSQQAPTLS